MFGLVEEKPDGFNITELGRQRLRRDRCPLRVTFVPDAKSSEVGTHPKTNRGQALMMGWDLSGGFIALGTFHNGHWSCLRLAFLSSRGSRPFLVVAVG